MLEDNKHEACCDEHCVHEDRVHDVAMNMLDEEALSDLADLFKVFGDTTRIRILYTLSKSELCVCDLAELLSMTQSAISHQLKNLKQAKLVRSRRDGKQVLYSLDDSHIASIINMGIEHIME